MAQMTNQLDGAAGYRASSAHRGHFRAFSRRIPPNPVESLAVSEFAGKQTSAESRGYTRYPRGTSNLPFAVCARTPTGPLVLASYQKTIIHQVLCARS
jgi:hypothetical protein